MFYRDTLISIITFCTTAYGDDPTPEHIGRVNRIMKHDLKVTKFNKTPDTFF